MCHGRKLPLHMAWKVNSPFFGSIVTLNCLTHTPVVVFEKIRASLLSGVEIKNSHGLGAVPC